VNQLAITTGEMTLVGLDHDPLVALVWLGNDAAVRTAAVKAKTMAPPRPSAVARGQSLNGIGMEVSGERNTLPSAANGHVCDSIAP
jgi:hypothetical protein